MSVTTNTASVNGGTLMSRQKHIVGIHLAVEHAARLSRV
jgi:hypothetical protein